MDLDIQEKNNILKEYLDLDSNTSFILDWNALMEVYNKILHCQLYEANDEDLDILMIIVGDNLLDSDREGFFLSLVEVVKYLNSKNNGN